MSRRSPETRAPGQGGRRRKQLLLASVAILTLALVCSSCGSKPATKQAKSSAPASTAPASTAPLPPVPGDIPRHTNSEQADGLDFLAMQTLKYSPGLTFAVFGDNRGSTKVFPDLLSRVSADDSFFAFDNGDLVNGGTVENYRMFVSQIQACTRPFLVSPGNHDDPDGDLYRGIFGERYYDFPVLDSQFIVLDDSNGRDIGEAQLAWLEKKLTEGQSFKNRFVFMHIPLFDPRPGLAEHALGDHDFAKKLNDLFDASHVTLLLTSHIHGYYEGVWGKTPYIISGGAGAPLQGSDPAHYFFHYIRVTVDDKGVTHEVVKI
jgi:hypothetical protein